MPLYCKDVIFCIANLTNNQITSTTKRSWLFIQFNHYQYYHLHLIDFHCQKSPISASFTFCVIFVSWQYLHPWGLIMETPLEDDVLDEDNQDFFINFTPEVQKAIDEVFMKHNLTFTAH